MTDPAHTFSIAPLQDGSRLLELSKRVDLRQVETVAYLRLLDKAANAERLGERVCEQLDAELVARGKAPSP